MQIEGFRVFCSVTHTFEPDNYRYCVLVATNEKLNQVEWEEGVRKTTWNSKEFSGFVCIPRHSVLLSHSPSCKKKTSKKKGNKLVPVITAECLMTLVPESGFFFFVTAMRSGLISGWQSYSPTEGAIGNDRMVVQILKSVSHHRGTDFNRNQQTANKRPRSWSLRCTWESLEDYPSSGVQLGGCRLKPFMYHRNKDLNRFFARVFHLPREKQMRIANHVEKSSKWDLTWIGNTFFHQITQVEGWE